MKDLNFDNNFKSTIHRYGDYNSFSINISFISELIEDNDINTVLRKSVELSLQDTILCYNPYYLGHLDESIVVGLPEYKEDIIWLIYDRFADIISPEYLEYMRKQYISKWNNLSSVLTYAHFDIAIRCRLNDGANDFESCEENVSDFSYMFKKAYGEWVYDLTDGKETVLYKTRDYAGSGSAEYIENTIDVNRLKKEPVSDLIVFSNGDRSIRIDKKCFDKCLKESGMSISDFTSVVQDENGRCAIKTVNPSDGIFDLNGHTITVHIERKDETLWQYKCSRILLQLSMVSEYAIYPAPGANSHARDMKNTMGYMDDFFNFVTTRCDPEYATKCFVNYLLFIETMKNDGLQVLTQCLREKAVTKKNGLLYKARVCYIEPAEVFSNNYDAFRIAFKCRNISETEIEVELRSNYCTGKAEYTYDDETFILYDYELFKRHYYSPNI